MLEIRQATDQDFESINEIYVQVDELHQIEHPHKFQIPDVPGRSIEYLSNLVDSSTSFLLVATYQEQVVGFAEAYILSAPDFPIMKKRKWLRLDTIAVDRDYRSRGIGQALFDHIKRQVEELEIDEIELGVYSFNKSAQKFYEKNGFKPVSITMSRFLK